MLRPACTEKSGFPSSRWETLPECLWRWISESEFEHFILNVILIGWDHLISNISYLVVCIENEYIYIYIGFPNFRRIKRGENGHDITPSSEIWLPRQLKRSISTIYYNLFYFYFTLLYSIAYIDLK